MSKPRKYHQETLDAMQRYFDCVEELLQRDQISISGYCNETGIDKRHWYVQRADHNRGFFEVYWITSLVKYKVNLNYILLGSGQMFR